MRFQARVAWTSLALIWLAAVQIPARAAAPALTPEKLVSHEQILAGFTNNRAQVIVTLVKPAISRQTDFKSKVSLNKLRAEIKRAQRGVLDKLPKAEVTPGIQFDNIPAFSAEVTLNGLKALQAHPDVVAIEPVLTFSTHLAQGISLIHGMTYRSAYNGAGLAIAICDSGVDYNHPSLGGGGFPNTKVLGGFDFGDNDADPIPNGNAHGTACAGIAAGDPPAVGDYIGGVAYGAKLYALKITSGSGSAATTLAMVAAWDWCVTHKNDNTNYPIMVISTSLGGGRFFSTCDGVTPSLTAAANNAVAAGITVVASSGNDGYCDSIALPACLSNVISVGAVYDAAFGHFMPCVNSASCAPKISTPDCTTGFYSDDLAAPDLVPSYANISSFLTLLAPSEQCFTLDITGPSGSAGGDYNQAFGGTSASCPYAAGAAACLQSAAKALTGDFLSPADIKARLGTYGDNVTDSKVAITRPRVNLERTIQSLGLSPFLNFLSARIAGGNGNGVIDPNECNQLEVIIRNDGNLAATNISATLASTTPDLTVTQPGSSYPDLVSGGTATNSVRFRISTAPSFQCGTPIALSLIVGFNGVTNSFAFTLPSGGTNYALSASSGAAIVPGVADIGNHGDDDTTPILLPFPCSFYGQAYNSAIVAANGNLQFTGNNSDYLNSCLPNANFGAAIFPHWDDLRTDFSGNGVFVSTNGTAPNRIFNIEWRAVYYESENNLNFEVRLYEGQARFDIIYGVLNGTGSSATVGIQKGDGAFYGYECNSGGLSNGLQLTFTQSCQDGGGFCGAPLANFTASPTNGPAPLTVCFTNLSSDATNYLWTFGDGNTSSSQNPTNIYTNPGVYTVSLTADGLATNTLTLTNLIIVTNPPPPVVAAFDAAPTNGVIPLTVWFTNLTTGASTYSWDFGDGHLSTSFSPTNTFTNAGSYTISLVAVGPGGTNILSRTNFVVATNPPVTANFSAGPTNGVAPLSVSFTNLTTGGSSYSWDFGDGNFSGNVNPTNTYTNAGSYNITLTAAGPGGTNALTRINFVVVTNPPPPVIAGFDASPTNGLVPLTVIFTNLTTGATSYSWDFGDGNSSSDINPNNTYTNAGSYTITLVAIGPGGTNGLTRTNFIVGTNLPVIANFNAGPTNGLAPLTVSFTNLTTGATSYAWDFGDGNSSSDINPTNTYTNGGSYTITLMAVGPGGTNALTLTNLVVATNLTVIANFNAAPTSGLVPLTVWFTNLSSGATSYFWDFGDGNVSADLNPIHTYTTVGSYTVTLIANGPGGQNSLNLPNLVTVSNPPPPVVANFTGAPTNGAAPLTVFFTNLTSGASSYSWDFGDGNSSTGLNPANTYTNAGTYTITLVAVGPGGTNSLSRTNFVVVTNPPPPVIANFNAAPTNGVAPLPVFFTNLTSGATSYLWDFGDGNSSTGLNPANTYTNAGTYTITLVAVGPGGTNSLSWTNLVVATNPPPPVIANFNADPTNGVAPLPVFFTNLTSGATSYIWDFGDGNSSTGLNPANTYTNAGTYTITLVAVGPGGTNSLSRTNFVVATNPPPPVIANFNADPTNGVAPLPVFFTNLTSGATSYLWDFGDGNSSTGLNPTNTYTNAGTYTITLVAVGPSGTNSLSQTNFVVVTNPPPVIANFNAAPTNGVAPLTVFFTNLTTGASSYSWDFGDGTSSTGLNPTNIYTNAGIYTVVLSASGPGGTNSSTNFITVIAPPQMVLAPTRADFGLITTGVTRQATLVISNAGAAMLNGSASISGGPFVILSGTPFHLTAQKRTNLVIQFGSAGSGVFTNFVVLSSNAGNSTNELTGRVIAPPSITSTVTAENLILEFDTLDGFLYHLQYVDHLGDPIWQELESIPGDGNPAHIPIPISTGGQRFFRLSVE